MSKYWIVYKCADSSETRGRTKQERKPCCGAWNIQKSRRDTEDSTQHQGRCKQCGKRTNLSKKNTWSFRTPEQAYEFLYKQSLKEESVNAS